MIPIPIVAGKQEGHSGRVQPHRGYVEEDAEALVFGASVRIDKNESLSQSIAQTETNCSSAPRSANQRVYYFHIPSCHQRIGDP